MRKNSPHTVRPVQLDHRPSGFLALLGKRQVTVMGECWIVNGEPDSYAYINDNGRLRQVHRVVYEYLTGPLWSDVVVHHRCFHPGCINPDHLEALTTGEHTELHAKMRRSGRVNAE